MIKTIETDFQCYSFQFTPNNQFISLETYATPISKVQAAIYLYDLDAGSKEPLATLPAKNHQLLTIPLGITVISSILSVAPQWSPDSTCVVSSLGTSVQIHALDDQNQFVEAGPILDCKK